MNPQRNRHLKDGGAIENSKRDIPGVLRELDIPTLWAKEEILLDKFDEKDLLEKVTGERNVIQR